MAAQLGIRAHHRLAIEHAIPRHAGLGSGTQIALAVAAALRALHGLPLDVGGDASSLARGQRSGIGIASFDGGGVIIDAGSSGNGGVPPVVARLPFPDEWRVILILDQGSPGCMARTRSTRFARCRPSPRAAAGEICRQVLMGVMPALIERDLAAFGAAVTAIQTLVGGHFAPAQGGLFTSKRVEALARRLVEAGAAGLGQSSWGPTGFVFAPSEEAATRMVAAAANDPAEGIDVKDRARPEFRRQDQRRRTEPGRQLKAGARGRKWPASTYCTC